MEYANVRGVRDFGRGDYLVDPAWQGGFKMLGASTTSSPASTRGSSTSRRSSSSRRWRRTGDLRRPLRLPAGALDDYFQMWRAGMKELAKVDDVWMKISGLGMSDPHWTVDSFRPWVLGSIETFGVEARSCSAPTGRSTACSAPTRTSSTPTPRSSRASAGRADRDVLRQRREAVPDMTAHEGGDELPPASVTGTHHVGMKRRRPRRGAGVLGRVSRPSGALAHGARQALSRPPRRLSGSGAWMQPSSTCPAVASSSCSSTGRRQEAPPRRHRQSRQRPHLPVGLGLRRGLEARGRLRREADRRGRAGRGDRRAEQGRAGRLSPHPRRHHAGVSPAAAERGSMR